MTRVAGTSTEEQHPLQETGLAYALERNPLMSGGSAAPLV
jgi:hypothetical protein